MILDEVNARIKLAEAKTAEDPSNFDSFPGAENDKAVPAETKEPDPEVKDEGPASRTEVSGAEPGSDVPLQQDHLYEADEPVLTPEKKPAESDDANAKEAAANPDVTKVASDILNIIKSNMAKKPTVEKTAAAKPAAEKTAAAKAPEAKAPEKKAENKEKDMISLGDKILDKIASARMAKQAGANDAAELVKAASEYNRGAADATALIQKLAQALAAEEAAAQGADAGAGTGAEPTPEELGAADAEAGIADAAAAAGGEGGEAGASEEEVTPEEVVEAVQELVQEGQISEEDAASVVSELGADAGAGDEKVTEDQIAEGIAQAIESGEMTEDEAQQLVQELVDAGADESVAEQVASDAGDTAGAAEAEAAGEADAAEALGAADAENALADAQKTAAAIENDQVARYQRGFIQKCAEYNVDPQKLAQYLQARRSAK